ncbi:type II toxin-antitoxin system VapC family toxin [Pontiella agarivorans]|uniref:Type II toxin-antitoxin system VapC family toxin n=1 Tax=Pontiella agarivorans TaxID=3038953 RepID=A0ABU5MVG5_9BACT|nr:type II toxin-antitoxin system VapC family toxin [Pontiella agarivorans]MDZ8118208.1 type II toxin-antitoxin system VapC family toxin [Pontiella agarivorans]
MKNAVFDSFALLSFIFNESDADRVAEYFKKALVDKKRIFITTVNWSEVMYRVIRAQGRNAWKTVQTHLHDLPIEIIDADLALSEAAAEFKAEYKMSLADAYAAALTKIKKAELVTGDPEFQPLEEKLKAIVWLKQ